MTLFSSLFNDIRMGQGALVAGLALLMATPQTFAAEVPTVVVKAKNLGGTYVLDGVIQPVKQSTIAAQASGRIASLQVKPGDKVRAGRRRSLIRG